MKKSRIINLFVAAVIISLLLIFNSEAEDEYKNYIVVESITKDSSGWYVESEGENYFLDKSASKGWEDPEVGKYVGLVMDESKIISKWKVVTGSRFIFE